MQATIKNFRSIGDTQIEINPIALVCGLNGAGKTSIARAIAAAATGRAVPYDKVTKKDFDKLLLRHGTHAGSVTLAGKDGTTEIAWPKGEIATDGMPPQASEVACGLIDILAMKEKDALAYLIKLLKAEPTKDDLTAALSAEEIGADVVDAIWKVIQSQGFEAAHKRAVETGQQRKGAWSQITGTNWGDEKAREWYPEGWEDSFADVPLEKLHHAVSMATQKLESKIAKNAISKSEHGAMVELAGKVGELGAEVERLQVAVGKHADALVEVDKELSKTPNPHATAAYVCPHCEKPVQINQPSPGKFTLAKSEKIDESRIKQLSLDYAALCGKKSKIEGEKNDATSKLQTAIIRHNEAVIVADKIKTATPADNEEEVANARVELAAVNHRLELVTKCHQSQVAMQQVFTNQKIVAILSETGLRKKKLSESLDSFVASYIDPLCNDFGIPVATLDVDMNVIVGTTSYQMLSESEQYRVRIVYQLAISQLEGAQIVIIDRADILDKAGRTKLFTTIINAGMPALICMTLNTPDQAPNLANSGHGITYWLEKGQCRAIGARKEAA